MGWAHVEKHLRIPAPPQPRQEGASPQAFPAALGLGCTKVQAERGGGQSWRRGRGTGLELAQGRVQEAASCPLQPLVVAVPANTVKLSTISENQHFACRRGASNKPR